MSIKNADQIVSLIKDCINNNSLAQKKLFDILSPTMFALCLRYAKNTEEAEDVLQEGFVKLFKNLKQFEGKGSFEGWAKRIFIHVSIEHYRKNQKDNVLSDFERVPEMHIDSNTLSLLKAADLMSIIQKLPTGYRTVFNLFAVEGYSHEEIAETLNISINTSKSQLFKARQHLQEIVLKQNLK